MFTKWLESYAEHHTIEKKRLRIGLLAGVIGLISNLLLFIVKLAAGWLSGSVSIMTDAINSLSDTASSILTLLGFKAASKPPDKEHPYGHERFEYISGLLVSTIIIFVGFQFLTTSVERIFNSTALASGPLIFVLLTVSIFAKIIQGLFYKSAATTIHSNTLRGAAQDSLNDVYTTIIVLLASLIEFFTGLTVDGYAGAILAIFIIYSGINMIRDSMDDLLGSRPNEKELSEIQAHFDQFDAILGYHDLLVHNYGPNKTYASIHIEVDDSWTLTEAHEVSDYIEKHFKDELGIDLICHLDPIAVQNEEHTRIYREVKAILKSYQLNLKFHDFRVEEGPENVKISFDIDVPEDITTSNEQLVKVIKQDISENVGEAEIEITVDRLSLLKH
ncbi:cation diffusion facilitator family transporter [Jeotgalibaca sp. A122]|uniref:cation diffusion facilitator family transporter n=1 Tax=Jeotgalibaca sp. A122 TaxID=3457322 RepID=UPI003FCFB997